MNPIIQNLLEKFEKVAFEDEGEEIVGPVRKKLVEAIEIQNHQYLMSVLMMEHAQSKLELAILALSMRSGLIAESFYQSEGNRINRKIEHCEMGIKREMDQLKELQDEGAEA